MEVRPDRRPCALRLASVGKASSDSLLRSVMVPSGGRSTPRGSFNEKPWQGSVSPAPPHMAVGRHSAPVISARNHPAATGSIPEHKVEARVSDPTSENAPMLTQSLVPRRLRSQGVTPLCKSAERPSSRGRHCLSMPSSPSSSRSRVRSSRLPGTVILLKPESANLPSARDVQMQQLCERVAVGESTSSRLDHKVDDLGLAVREISDQLHQRGDKSCLSHTVQERDLDRRLEELEMGLSATQLSGSRATEVDFRRLEEVQGRASNASTHRESNVESRLSDFRWEIERTVRRSLEEAEVIKSAAFECRAATSSCEDSLKSLLRRVNWLETNIDQGITQALSLLQARVTAVESRHGATPVHSDRNTDLSQTDQRMTEKRIEGLECKMGQFISEMQGEKARGEAQDVRLMATRSLLDGECSKSKERTAELEERLEWLLKTTEAGGVGERLDALGLRMEETERRLAELSSQFRLLQGRNQPAHDEMYEDQLSLSIQALRGEVIALADMAQGKDAQRVANLAGVCDEIRDELHKAVADILTRVAALETAVSLNRCQVEGLRLHPSARSLSVPLAGQVNQPEPDNSEKLALGGPCQKISTQKPNPVTVGVGDKCSCFGSCAGPECDGEERINNTF